MQAQESRVRRESLAEQFQQTRCDLSEIMAGLAGDAAVPDWESAARGRARGHRAARAGQSRRDRGAARSSRSARTYLDRQYGDLNDALETLEDAMRRIDKETRARFKDTFDRVNAGLKEKFPRLFGGGHAYLELIGEDLLAAGVAIMARPPGKRNSTISPAVGRREGADGGGAGVLDLRPQPGAVLPAGRGRRAAGRAQRRPLLRHRARDVRRACSSSSSPTTRRRWSWPRSCSASP